MAVVIPTLHSSFIWRLVRRQTKFWDLISYSVSEFPNFECDKNSHPDRIAMSAKVEVFSL
jgi:hypothetical protein